MRKKIIFSIIIPIVIISLCSFIFYFYTVVLIDGVYYNKRNLENIINNRNDSYSELNESFHS